MSKMKNILASLLAVAMMASVGTSVMASEPVEAGEGAITKSEVNLRGERPIAKRVDVSLKTRGEPDVEFSHTYGFELTANGSSGTPDERVWGKTFHIYRLTGQSAQGYTRARYEKGNKTSNDSERVWGLGISEARSGWLTGLFGWTGHTYYGH